MMKKYLRFISTLAFVLMLSTPISVYSEPNSEFGSGQVQEENLNVSKAKDSTFEQIKKGTGRALYDLVALPFRMLYDDSLAIYYMATGKKKEAREWVYGGHAKSDFSKAVHIQFINNPDSSYIKNSVNFAGNMIYSIVHMPWDIEEMIECGDYEQASYLATTFGLTVVLPAAYGAAGVTLRFPPGALKFIPRPQGGQMAYAVVATRTVTFEGFSIQKGAIVAMASGGVAAGTGFTPDEEVGLEYNEKMTPDDLQEQMQQFESAEEGSFYSEHYMPRHSKTSVSSDKFVKNFMENADISAETGQAVQLKILDDGANTFGNGALVETSPTVTSKRGVILDLETNRALGTFEIVARKQDYYASSSFKTTHFFTVDLTIDYAAPNAAKTVESMIPAIKAFVQR